MNIEQLSNIFYEILFLTIKCFIILFTSYYMIYSDYFIRSYFFLRGLQGYPQRMTLNDSIVKDLYYASYIFFYYLKANNFNSTKGLLSI